MFCTQCGTRNPEGARFCANCGAALFAADDAPTSTISLSEHVEGDADNEVAAPVEELREGTAMLVVRRGPNAGSRFLLDKDVVTAGRHPESDIFLDDITVSRRHAEIRRGAAGSFTVHDVGSLNGTYLNRERVDDDELANGDELQVGKFKLVFFAGSRPADG
jgi:pSer/pThr/pTyr-binding forkhead associated (FHA) protein